MFEVLSGGLCLCVVFGRVCCYEEVIEVLCIVVNFLNWGDKNVLFIFGCLFFLYMWVDGEDMSVMSWFVFIVLFLFFVIIYDCYVYDCGFVG